MIYAKFKDKVRIKFSSQKNCKIVVDGENNISKVLNNYIAMWTQSYPMTITEQYESLKIE